MTNTRQSAMPSSVAYDTAARLGLCDENATMKESTYSASGSTQKSGAAMTSVEISIVMLSSRLDAMAESATHAMRRRVVTAGCVDVSGCVALSAACSGADDRMRWCATYIVAMVMSANAT